MWLNVLLAYIHLKLSRPTDRLPTLAGLAWRFEAAAAAAEMPVAYFGGHFAANPRRLALVLLWRIYRIHLRSESRSTPRVAAFGAPSWSMASLFVNGSDSSMAFSQAHGFKEVEDFDMDPDLRMLQTRNLDAENAGRDPFVLCGGQRVEAQGLVVVGTVQLSFNDFGHELDICPTTFFCGPTEAAINRSRSKNKFFQAAG